MKKAGAAKKVKKTAARSGASRKVGTGASNKKTAARSGASRKVGTGASKSRAKPAAESKSKLRAPSKGTKVVLLSGGNPQIPKGDGDAPVQAYIAAMPEWKRDVGRRLDALVSRVVPGAQKAVKWNSPFYGVEGRGWFLSFHVFARYVKVTFFRGVSLRPIPPGPSKDKNVRYMDIYEGGLDEKQMAAWIKQAAALPGWIM